VVKWAYGFHSARSLTPHAAVERIRDATRTAVERRREFTPYRVATPVALDVSFKHYQPSEILAYLSIVQRVDAHTIRFSGRDMLEVSRFLQFLSHYQPGLSP
jgi:D-amino peptidase